ncbi:MAG: type II toxin-antitoxin system RatA family toxin [Francisellaceae bacterium]|jgi:ribosome-associated toxin RatA of RatAB toxin-antitoxin module|nr:type II toxin-antitoxin system RatA family toxin [Francisellaceae bacterium]MBT6208074.1 type II toxin-antitoxin system RatA family toxin [Francisellaceae bacterium]MBT6538788.1 type II toxin-antitoxin system RatA family toxin [Francisellaceae bacterium]
MPKISQKLLVEYSPEQMFALVNDIEQYPKFLPGCTSAKILSVRESGLTARVDLARGPVSMNWVSENINIEPSSIEMNYIEGSFSSMHGYWSFASDPEGNCMIEFTLNYSFSSKFIELTLNPILSFMISTIVYCFKEQAEKVYTNE